MELLVSQAPDVVSDSRKPRRWLHPKDVEKELCVGTELLSFALGRMEG